MEVDRVGHEARDGAPARRRPRRVRPTSGRGRVGFGAWALALWLLMPCAGLVLAQTARDDGCDPFVTHVVRHEGSRELVVRYDVVVPPASTLSAAAWWTLARSKAYAEAATQVGATFVSSALDRGAIPGGSVAGWLRSAQRFVERGEPPVWLVCEATDGLEGIGFDLARAFEKGGGDMVCFGGEGAVGVLQVDVFGPRVTAEVSVTRATIEGIVSVARFGGSLDRDVPEAISATVLERLRVREVRETIRPPTPYGACFGVTVTVAPGAD